MNESPATWMDEFPRTSTELQRIVTEAVVARGVQVWAQRNDEPPLDVAIGEAVGGDMTPDTVHATFCLSKPLLAIALAHLRETHDLDFDVPMSSLELAPPSTYLDLVGSLSIRNLLNHQAGLGRPSGVEYRMTPPNERQRLVCQELQSLKVQNEYSDIVSGLILEEIIAGVAGMEASEAISQMVLSPLRIAADVALTPTTALSMRRKGRLSVPMGGLPTRPFPLLSEALDAELTSVRPAFSIIWNMRAAGTLVHSVCRTLRGAPSRAGSLGPDTLSYLLHKRSPAISDPAVGRTLQFAGGFMTGATVPDMSQRCGESAIGHVSGVMTAVAIADPDTGISVAVLLNGADLDPTLAKLERRVIVDAIHDDMAARGPTDL